MQAYMGILVVSPYLLYQLFHFIAPALYANERRCVVRSVVSGFVLFSDIFTLLLVSLPMCLLYEAGIWVAARAGREA